MPGWKYEKTVAKAAIDQFKLNSNPHRPIVAKKLMFEKAPESSSWFERRENSKWKVFFPPDSDEKASGEGEKIVFNIKLKPKVIRLKWFSSVISAFLSKRKTRKEKRKKIAKP